MDINILERADIPINDYSADKPNFSLKYPIDDNNLSNLKEADNISKFHHSGLNTKATLVRSEHEPLFYAKNMMDNSQQGDTLATIMKSNLWVPAERHPQIAPVEFTNWIKQYKDEKPENSKSRSKLRRKKSLLSAVSYPSTESDNATSTEQSLDIKESKHRTTQKSLLRRQVVYAHKKGQRGLPVLSENSLYNIKASKNQESQDQINNNTKNKNGQSSVTHLNDNETQTPTQKKVLLPDIFPKRETQNTRMMEVMGAPRICMQKEPSIKKKTWSFSNLFKTSNNSSSSLSRFFFKALPNNRQKSLLRRKRSSSVKKKRIGRNSFSPIDSERLPLYLERAIYHLSHVKLTNTKRPLCQQVVISNMIYTYLTTPKKQSNCIMSPHFESSHYYPDRFEPPRHHTEEEFPDDDALKKDSKKQKKKYKPVQNKQYNSSVSV